VRGEPQSPLFAERRTTAVEGKLQLKERGGKLLTFIIREEKNQKPHIIKILVVKVSGRPAFLGSEQNRMVEAGKRGEPRRGKRGEY